MAAPGAFEHCRRLIAERSKEQYWSTFYAPAERRKALYALYAFDHEIARIARAVRDPMAGEVRLQWWREVVESQRGEEAAANPVAAALLDSIQGFQLPAARLIALIDARGGDLYPEERDFDTYGAVTSATVIALASQILGETGEAIEHIAHHAGLAQVYAEARRSEEACDHLAAAGGLLGQIPSAIFPALLPVAVLGRPVPRTMPAWRRQWLIWRAARDPRRIFG